MDLSNDLISKFVKITNDADKQKPKEGTVYGTAVKYDGDIYVKIDGSDLLTPVDTTADIQDGERVTITIKDHNATVTGNITSPSANEGTVTKKVTEAVDGIEDKVITEVEILVADRVSTKELDAEVARIDELIAGKASVEDLTATNAEITNLKADKASIKDLTATNAEITNLKAKDAEIENLVADKASIEDLTATNAEITNLKAKDAEIENLVADKARIEDLTATNARIDSLQANKADITYLDANFATIDELEAAHADIEILDAELADINTLVNGNLTSDNILSLNITSQNTTMENAFVKDAMIDTVTANKIMSGTIDTNNVTIQSTDGSMLLQGTLLQMKDDNGKVRIQIGKDTGGNFTFILYDESGTGVLIDEEGIKSSDAIADGLIVDAKVADNANIAGSKLDIASVITEVNNDNSTTIKSHKIYLDEQGQSLEVAFNSLKTQVETIQDVTIDGDLTAVIEQVQSNTTQIAANKEGISTLVSENTIRKEEIQNLDGEIESVNNTLSSKYSSLEQDVSGFKTTVADTYTTKSEFNNLQIGGRNLATLSNIREYIGGGLSNNRYYSVEGTKIIAKNQPLNSSVIGFKIYTDNTFEYTVSGYTDMSLIHVFFRCYDKNNTIIQNQTFHSKAVVDGKFISSFNNIPKDTYYFNIGIGNVEAANYFIDKLKIEKGNKATDWSPAPEDVQGQIDAVDGKFANYSTTTQMNSAISQKANEITSSVSQTYATKQSVTDVNNKFSNYSTTSAMNSAIQQKANEITSSVSETYTTKTEFNNLQIGGRNLIRQSVMVGYSVSKFSYDKNTATWTLTAIPGAGESWGAGLDISGDSVRIPYGKTYVLSFEIKVPRACSWNIDVNNYAVTGSSWNGNDNDDFSARATSSRSLVANQWIKCWSRISNTSSLNTDKVDIFDSSNFGVVMQNETSDMTFQIRNIQGEIGNIPSEYTPAPEDVQGQIDAINTNLTTYATKSELTQTNNSIVAKFSESGGYNYLYNGNFKNGTTHWTVYSDAQFTLSDMWSPSGRGVYTSPGIGKVSYIEQTTTLDPTVRDYTVSCMMVTSSSGTDGTTNPMRHLYVECFYEDGSVTYHMIDSSAFDMWEKRSITITRPGSTRFKTIKVCGYVRDTSKIAYFADFMVEKGVIANPWSPHPNEIHDGITQIDKDGIKVSQSNYNGYTQMKADGFYVNNGSENVISITKDGSYFKGKVVITSGSTVPTSVLSGTISSSQLNSSITSDISTAKSNASTAVSTANTASTNASNAVKTANTASTNASNAVSTANTASTNASNAVKTANTASTNASTAVSTANTAKSTADSVKSTVDSGKTNWNNAYNRVNEWAYGAVTGSTTIDGGYIQTNTILANKLAIGDFNNYCDLRYGFSSGVSWAPLNWNSNGFWNNDATKRYIQLNQENTTHAFNNNDSINFTFDFWIDKSVTLYIGLWYYDSSMNLLGCNYASQLVSTLSTWHTISKNVTVSEMSTGTKYVRILLDLNTTGCNAAIRNIKVFRMNGGELIVDGAITAAKIASRTITADRIASGVITANEIKSRTITADRIVSGAITANEIASRTITADRIASGVITANEIKSRTITADRIVSGAITANEIAANAITVDKIAAGAITADKLAANAITGKTITGSTITGGTISGATITSETLMKTYGGMYVGSEIWGGFKKDSNGNYSSAQTFTIRGNAALQIDGNPTRISSVTGEVKIGDASSYDNLRAREIYAQEIIYTNDLRTRDAAQLSLSNVSMRSANSFIDFSSGYGVIRVVDRSHLYLQTGGNTGGDSSAEIRCTRYKDVTNYVNIRAHNVCAQNAVYAAGVNVSSDRARKRDIELYSTDALHEVCTTPVYTYHLDTDKDEELKRIGIIMQEAPLDAIDLTGKGVDLYQMVTMLWRAVQQQQEIINELKGE